MLNAESKIKQFRKLKGLTQQQLANKIHKTKSSVQKYENLQASIALDVLEDIAMTLDFQLYDFLQMMIS